MIARRDSPPIPLGWDGEGDGTGMKRRWDMIQRTPSLRARNGDVHLRREDSLSVSDGADHQAKA